MKMFLESACYPDTSRLILSFAHISLNYRTSELHWFMGKLKSIEKGQIIKPEEVMVVEICYN